MFHLALMSYLYPKEVYKVISICFATLLEFIKTNPIITLLIGLNGSCVYFFRENEDFQRILQKILRKSTKNLKQKCRREENS